MSSTRSNLTIDQRGIPSNECINCGSNIQVIRAIFADYELVMWFLDSFCAGCGSPMTAPTPVDNPDYKEEDDDDLY
ncbi:MAG: hypothetical protein EBU08_21115 [Micrococcales bacterium]|nr:hypothetical protein [Micrococcales bacterium]